MAPRKPTGQVGPVSISTGPGGNSLDWQRVAFSDKKPEIEKQIITMFCRAWKDLGAFVHWEQNEENDLDFTLHLAGGKAYLDLMEIIYWTGQRKPHGSERQEIKFGEYADQIIEQITRKTQHYPKGGAVPLQLLTYTTHWSFFPPVEVLYLVKKHFAQQEHPFEHIFFLSPLDAVSGSLHCLYPADLSSYVDVNDDELRQGTSFLLHPGKWELKTGRDLE